MPIKIDKLACFCFAFFIASSALTGISHAQPFLRDVVAIWLFDDSKGKMVQDSSGNKIHGEFGGKPEYVEGKFGTALRFGGPDEGDWVEMKDAVAIDSVDFSFGCWMKPDMSQICFSTVLSGRDRDHVDSGFSFEQSNCLVNWYRIVIGGVINWDGIGNPRNAVQVEPEQWNHVVFVRQGREGIWYLNGEPDRQKRGKFYIDLGSDKPLKPQQDNFRIGSTIFAEGRAFVGALDEVFIFSRALSQLEIAKVMEDGLVGAQAVDAKDKIATLWGRIKS